MPGLGALGRFFISRFSLLFLVSWLLCALVGSLDGAGACFVIDRLVFLCGATHFLILGRGRQGFGWPFYPAVEGLGIACLWYHVLVCRAFWSSIAVPVV